MADAGAGAEPAGGDGTRFQGVNGLRAAAAFTVLAFHVGFVAPPPGLGASLSFHFQYGVSLFFVISGFLLFRPFARALWSGGKVDLVRYLQSRALRILPLYLVAVVVILLLDGSRRHLGLVLRSLTFTGVYSGARVTEVVQPVAWSLDDEMVFYLFLPLLFLVLLWLVKPARRFRAAAVAIVILAAASLAFRAYLVSVLHLDQLSPEPEVLMRIFPAKLELFALGMILAMLQVRKLQRVTSPQAYGLLGVGALSLVAGVVALYHLGAFADFLMGTGFALLLTAVVLSPPATPLSAVLASRPLWFLGEISYGVYLWHFPVIRQLALFHLVGSNYLLALAEVALVTIAIASATYVIVERPFLMRKRLWLRGASRDTVAAKG
jgi:peptidoglycan/LPS O-acetylase OafA/YrhL